MLIVCMQVASRYYGVDSGNTMLLPIFDLANHHNGCLNTMVWSDDNALEVVAGQDLSAGEEVSTSLT